MSPAWIRLSCESGSAGPPGPNTSSSTRASTSATADTALKIREAHVAPGPTGDWPAAPESARSATAPQKKFSQVFPDAPTPQDPPQNDHYGVIRQFRRDSLTPHRTTVGSDKVDLRGGRGSRPFRRCRSARHGSSANHFCV